MKKKLLIGLSIVFCVFGIIKNLIKKESDLRNKITFSDKAFNFGKKPQKDGFKKIIESLAQNIEALGVNFSKTNQLESK